MKVGHNLDDIALEQEITLVIEDTPVIKDGKLNTEEDVLINPLLIDHQKIEANLRQQKKEKTAEYNPSELYANQIGSKNYLPQYDKETYVKSGFYVSIGDTIHKDTALLEGRAPDEKKNGISLEQNNKYEIPSDYMTQSEMISQKIRTRQKQKKASNLNNLLNDEYNSGDTTSLKQRDYSEVLNENKEKKINHRSQFNMALEKARKVNASVQFFDKSQDEIEEEEYLKRKMKKIIVLPPKQQEKNSENVDDNVKSEDFGKMLLVVEKHNAASMEGKEIREINTKTDFLKGIQSSVGLSIDECDSEETLKKINPKQKFGVQHAKEGIKSVVEIEMPSERIIQKNEPNLSVEEQAAKAKASMNEDITEKDLTELKFMYDFDLRRSAADAIRYFEARGMFGERAKEYSGRAKDKKKVTDKSQTLQKKNTINLEYRDERGKLMTPKEAFRYLCHQFHNQKPSKNKIEKRRRQEEQRQKAAFLNPQDNKLLHVFEHLQQKSGQAYVDLSKILK